MDLRDTYLHILIHPNSRNYLRFCMNGSVYQFLRYHLSKVVTHQLNEYWVIITYLGLLPNLEVRSNTLTDKFVWGMEF